METSKTKISKKVNQYINDTKSTLLQSHCSNNSVMANFGK